MYNTLQLRTLPQVAADQTRLLMEASTALNIDANRIKSLVILRRSIDARRRPVMINLTVGVHIDEIDTSIVCYQPIHYPNVENGRQVIVVGAGPAGLFAALELIEAGLRPIVLERGKDVDARRRDMAKLCREGVVNSDSNYCFGEGGAGAYSDGKLYTRSTKRGPVDKVLQIFHTHGAKDDILIDAHPHIGTDRLPVIIKAMRYTIIEHGGQVLFNTRVERLVMSANRVTGVVTANGEQFEGPVILATGHSARDVYAMLHSSHIAMEAKGIAVGVRLEHLQHLIDCIQYHSPQGRGKYLPAAEYSMLTRVDGRGVYSFCMCPGGVIIPAASEPGQLVVNGMSPSNRGTRWANSGMVVEVLPEDLPTEYDQYGVLRMMHFQLDIEQKFFAAAGNTQVAPAQRMTDFVASRLSTSLPPTSYAPGIQPARIDHLLPVFIAGRLQAGFSEFGRKARGFLSAEATLIGCETRTSSPVRIPRDLQSRCHIAVSGLYPVGEGAGYAGGIVSAAIDGINSARALAAALQ